MNPLALKAFKQRGLIAYLGVLYGINSQAITLSLREAKLRTSEPRVSHRIKISVIMSLETHVLSGLPLTYSIANLAMCGPLRIKREVSLHLPRQINDLSK